MSWYNQAELTFYAVRVLSHVITCTAGFLLAVRIINNRDNGLKSKINMMKKNVPLDKSVSPISFEACLVEGGEYCVFGAGIDGKHVNPENHRKLISALSGMVEIEKSRPLTKTRDFKLLTFKDKDKK